MEAHRFFKKIEDHWKTNKPFVVYKAPNSKKIKVQLQNNCDYKDVNLQEKGFLFAPFTNENSKKIWFPLRESLLLEANLSKEQSNEFFEKSQPTAVLDKKKHINIIEDALLSLKSKNLQKVVLSRKETVSLNNSKPFEYFKNACILYPNTFCYCWYHPTVGMWVGATPETLVKLNKNSFETMALAGTMPYKGTENVNWGVKEIEEQQIVVDSILKELASEIQYVETGITTTQRAGNLLHLKTPISGILNSNKGLNKLIDLLHPTSAVCGLPKKKAKDFILNNEGYDRKYYTGYLGEVNPEGNSSLFVNLRCMEIEENQLSLYVGGGITALSNANKEWQETVNKSQIMKRIL